jgi:hypothetical protein
MIAEGIVLAFALFMLLQRWSYENVASPSHFVARSP